MNRKTCCLVACAVMACACVPGLASQAPQTNSWPAPPEPPEVPKDPPHVRYCIAVVTTNIAPLAHGDDTACRGDIQTRICASVNVTAYMLRVTLWGEALECTMPMQGTGKVKVLTIANHVHGDYRMRGYHHVRGGWKARTWLENRQQFEVGIDGVGAHEAHVRARATSSTGHVLDFRDTLAARGTVAFGVQISGTPVGIGHTPDFDRAAWSYGSSRVKHTDDEFVCTTAYGKESLAIAKAALARAGARARTSWRVEFDSLLTCRRHGTRAWFQFKSRSNHQPHPRRPHWSRWVVFSHGLRSGGEYRFATPAGPDLQTVISDLVNYPFN